MEDTERIAAVDCGNVDSSTHSTYSPTSAGDDVQDHEPWQLGDSGALDTQRSRRRSRSRSRSRSSSSDPCRVQLWIGTLGYSADRRIDSWRSEQCGWTLHVPSLQDGVQKGFKWPMERGSPTNRTEHTKKAWHGTTLAALTGIVRDGFLRNHKPNIDNGTGVWLAKHVQGCEYYSQHNNPRVRLQAEVPDVDYHPRTRTRSIYRPKQKSQWLYDERWVVIKKIVFVGDCTYADQGDFDIPVLQA